MTPGTMGVKLETKIKKRLKSLAQVKERSIHWMMKTAILEYLEHEEHREKEKREDRKRWERYDQSGEFITHDIVSAWLNSIGTDQEQPCPR